MRRSVFVVVLCALFLFTGVISLGYAEVTDILSLEGSATADPPKIVFITSATATTGNASDIAYSGTLLSSTVTLDNGANSKTILSVTLKNNSPFAYKFNGLTYDAADYDNTGIKATLTGISKGTELLAGASTTATITFSYANGVVANKTLHSLLDISFVLSSEYVAVDNSLARFEQILNEPDTLQGLYEAMDTTNGRPNNSYIGNVAGSSNADSTALNNLFTVDGENVLKLEVGGKTVNVTAIIKNENIIGDDQNEMTIYMTGSEITGSLFRPGSIQVFAAVYRKNAEGKWAMIGQLYEGRANSNNYNGGWGSHNSFNTDTWESYYEYHGIAAGASIETVIAAAP
ncbi:MAG: hypothetical protein IJV96_03380 [Clostridia bacterium]|nr:hypothetical protein [Clostridia bacterium]